MNVNNSKCLNCGSPLHDKYCGACGQKSSTHRYSMKHFIEHDFVHGVWHLDKGIIYTVKELLLRPGSGVREYILGKRARYFNVITLIVMLLAISSLLGHYTPIKLSDLSPDNSKSAMRELENFTTRYPKIVLLINVPLQALFSFLWFRKAGYNYTEHLVLNAYKATVELIIGILFTTVCIFYTNVHGLMMIYYVLVQGLVLVYSVIYYRNFFAGAGYSPIGLLWRAIATPLSVMFLAMIIGVIWAIMATLS